MSFAALFSPARIGTMEVKNRFVVPAILSGLANPDGTVSDRLIDYWVARARGGFGLLVTELSCVDPSGKAAPGQLGVWDDAFIPGLRKLPEAVHPYGAKIALQIHHAGRETSRSVTGSQPVAPSAVPCPIVREIPRELTPAEIEELIEKFGAAALRAKRAGFDAVEIHACHGCLVSDFMSAYANKRLDGFGGDLRGRMRFAMAVVEKIRSLAGPDFPVLFRMSGAERVPGGRAIMESKAAARLLEEAGVSAIHVSTGVNASGPWIVAPACVSPGYNVADAAAIKEAVGIPVLAVGRINDPDLAEEIIRTGQADLISLGRESLADPEFPNKVADGRNEEIAPCIACMQRCQGRGIDENDTGVSCLVNPFCGKEGTLKIAPAAQPKRILVAGAGPGGLEAAWILAQRGHRVTLYEKEPVPGGQYRSGAVPPFKQDIAKAVRYYLRMGQKYGVDYRFGTAVTADLVRREQPDAVILATGGQPLVPELEGADGPRIIQAADLLAGRATAGERVLIVGGGMVGVETADFLGERRHRVTIVERLPQLAGDLNPAVQYFLFERLQRYGVTMISGAQVTAFLEDGVRYEQDGRQQSLTGFDTIVLAMGVRPDHSLAEELKEFVPQVFVIGDALKPRKALEAIAEGARLAVGM
jgi:2,4-dienoyl-CoA reductase-like NADH-dependent reductase (Old Yellow Enzyme family)/thioredoxin reductase